MTNQRNEAEVLAIKLQAGLATVADAVAWADQQIEIEDDPNEIVLDISMASKRLSMDVAAMLQNLPGEVNMAIVLRNLFESIKSALQSDSRTTWVGINAIFQLANSSILPEGRFAEAACWFDNQMYFISDGTFSGTQKEAIAEVLRQMEKALEELEDEVK